jgi:hypothetical protein
LLESVSGVVEVVCAREYSGGVVTCEEERVEGGQRRTGVESRRDAIYN